MLDRVNDVKFYVYLHRRADNGNVFYVGKGQGNRHIVHTSRNTHWKNTSRKYGWFSEIIYRCNNEEIALELEELIILTIGVDNLCNMIISNRGNSGFNHSIESRNKMSISKKGIIPWNKGVRCEYASIRMSGKNNPMYGKKKIHSLEAIEKMRKKNGTLVCDSHTGIFYDSITEASQYICIGRKTNKLKRRLIICN